MNAHINIETPTKTTYVKGLNGIRAITAMALLCIVVLYDWTEFCYC